GGTFRIATPSRSPMLTPNSSVGVHTRTFGLGGISLKPASASNRSSSVTAAECSPGKSGGADEAAISLAFKFLLSTGPTHGIIVPVHLDRAQLSPLRPFASTRAHT